MPTAPDPTKPPTNAIEIVGAIRRFSNSTRSSHSVSRVREKIAIAADRDDEVQPGDQARRGAEGKVDRAPGERDRKDQDADEDEERPAEPDIVVVPRVRPDPRGRSSHG